MLEQMYRAVSGASTEEEAPKLPDNLTEEKMVTVVNAFFAASNTVLRDIVEELVAQARYLVPYRSCRLADDLLSVWWKHATISQFQPRVCWCWRLFTLTGCNVVVWRTPMHPDYKLFVRQFSSLFEVDSGPYL